ncbi:MAG: MBL fold metallo-hydrolase [Myxococcota bacterium]
MHDTTTIDCEYLDRPQFAAAYLITDGKKAAFIDNCTSRNVPQMMTALQNRGLGPDAVEYVIITHVHLDHAGGTSALLQACPQATVVAHPRAARHVIDPSKLVSSASAVYGADEFKKLYGTIEPIPEGRVMAMEDNEVLSFGSGQLRFMHTRGHANHHFCILDESSQSLFTGDAFGLHYPRLQGPGQFVFPSTSPTDFDGPLARDSVQRIVNAKPQRVFPTHFGEVTAIETAGRQLLRHLEFHEAVMLDAEQSELADDALTTYCQIRLKDYFAGLFNQHGDLGMQSDIWSFVELDLNLNGQGLAFAANKRRRKSGRSK